MEAPYDDEITLQGSLFVGGGEEDHSDGELDDETEQTFRELLYNYANAPKVPRDFLEQVERQVQEKLVLYSELSEKEKGGGVWQKIKGLLIRKSEKELVEEKKVEWRKELKSLLTTNMIDQSLSDVSVEAVQDQLRNNPYLGFYQTLDEAKDILHQKTKDLSELLNPSIQQKKRDIEQLEVLLSQLKAVTQS